MNIKEDIIVAVAMVSVIGFAIYSLKRQHHIIQAPKAEAFQVEK